METTALDKGRWTPPAGWPAMSRQQCREMLTAPGQRFEMEEVEIRGVRLRTWKNAPPSLRAIALAGRAHGDSEFVVYEDERITFDGWFRAVATLAHHLQELGVAKGDRVALAMRNLPEWPVAFFAATSIGAIIVPLNAWWTSAELSYGLSDSGAKVLICDNERWERIAPHTGELPDLERALISRATTQLSDPASALEDLIGKPPDYAALPARELPHVAIQPDDDATIFYTSGTTGMPKGALGTHRNITTNVLSGAYAVACAALRRGEAPPQPVKKTGLVVIPLFHVTACSASLMGTIVAGNRAVYMYRWDPEKAFAIIEREKVNATGGVPTIAWQLLDHPARDRFNLSSIESIAYGGAPAAPDLVRRIHSEFGALPSNGYGMTETMATVTSHSSEDYLNRPDSCGHPVAVVDLKITGDDGESELPPGEVGEIWVRGPQVVKGYWNRSEETAECFIDGWVRTGDLGRVDEEGFLFIVDRAKDMIIRGGENIYSCEVENVLYDHPAVSDAALVGLPHATLGEEPAAVVHLAPGKSATEADLQAWVGEHLARFKVPVRIAFSPETLPRNANGKILKGELQHLLDGATEKGTAGEVRPPSSG